MISAKSWYLSVSLVKNLPAKQETQFQSLSQEDLLEKEMAIHSSIVTWEFPWSEEAGRLWNQPWIDIGRADDETEEPIFWPPDVENWLIGKHPDEGKDWGQEEKGAADDEMVGWHHWLNGHEFEQAPGRCSWGHKESDMT